MNRPVFTVAGGKRNPWLRAPLVVALGFVLAILVGSWLLCLSASVVPSHRALSWPQALFMATSATCVTGLSVVNVAHDLSLFGQIVLLGLIQIGGLGIMTLAFLVLLSLGGETSSGGEVLQSTLGELVYRYRPRRALLLVLGITICLEAAGAVFLHTQLDEAHAGWKSVFLSISAFCNAGFDNLDEGLAPYHASWGVGAPLLLLWLVGGLGFIVPAAVAAKVSRGAGSTLDLTAWMILRASLLLIPLGAVLFAVTEHTGLLAGRGMGEQLLLCLFQGNTPRTAGFSMLDYGHAGRATLFSQIGLMLIGGAPCSTAGGMKMTAVWVFGASLWSRMLNRDQVLIGRRAIPVGVIRQAMIVCVCMLLAFGVFSAAVATIEPALRFDALSFEVASALGTVGLSTGITSTLSEPSQLLIVLAMFMGRLGPLGFVYAFVRVRPKPTSVRYPESDVCVG
ncbi:MAG TPA: potassium transporter TrkG [Planctomycetota bacterium]|nr:potassium transporter TrkG [Planctomycetota bacterium]